MYLQFFLQCYRAILNIRITHFTRQIFICIFPIKIGPNLSQQVRTGLTKPAPTFPTHFGNTIFRKNIPIFSRFFRPTFLQHSCRRQRPYPTPHFYPKGKKSDADCILISTFRLFSTYFSQVHSQGIFIFIFDPKRAFSALCHNPCFF